MSKLITLVVGLFVLIGVYEIVKLFLQSSKGKSVPDLSVYKKKSYLFDTVSEFNLYKKLLEWFGDRYHIFPQINYSHLIEVKKMDFKEERKHRSRIDRKSADFIFCDKERVVPQLIIELDGSVHDFVNKQKRDEFINDIGKVAELPILHIKTFELDNPELVKARIEEMLK